MPDGCNSHVCTDDVESSVDCSTDSGILDATVNEATDPISHMNAALLSLLSNNFQRLRFLLMNHRTFGDAHERARMMRTARA